MIFINTNLLQNNLIRITYRVRAWKVGQPRDQKVIQDLGKRVKTNGRNYTQKIAKMLNSE